MFHSTLEEFLRQHTSRAATASDQESDSVEEVNAAIEVETFSEIDLKYGTSHVL